MKKYVKKRNIIYIGKEICSAFTVFLLKQGNGNEPMKLDGQ